MMRMLCLRQKVKPCKFQSISICEYKNSNMNKDEAACHIKKAIEELIHDFKEFPNKYLTEEDVRIHLCFLLMRHFGCIQKTADNDRSIALHTEVRWWGENESKELSDIVIFNVEGMSVTPNEIRSQKRHRLIPRKGYAADTAEAVIELKLRRNDGCSDAQYISKINSDIDKLEKISMWFCNENKKTSFWVVALDKKSEIQEDKIPRSKTESVNFRYGYSSVYNDVAEAEYK